MSSKRKRRAKRPIGRDRQISIRSARRARPDLRKFARAIVSLAMAQAEAEAQAQAQAEDLARKTERDSDESAPSSDEGQSHE